MSSGRTNTHALCGDYAACGWAAVPHTPRKLTASFLAHASSRNNPDALHTSSMPLLPARAAAHITCAVLHTSASLTVNENASPDVPLDLNVRSPHLSALPPPVCLCPSSFRYQHAVPLLYHPHHLCLHPQAHYYYCYCCCCQPLLLSQCTWQYPCTPATTTVTLHPSISLRRML